jgi:hypothetical protein
MYIETDDQYEEDSGCFSPGMPDRESSESFALWIDGLLDDPLSESDVSAAEGGRK